MRATRISNGVRPSRNDSETAFAINPTVSRADRLGPEREREKRRNQFPSGDKLLARVV